MKEKLISNRIKDTVEHMLWEKSQGIITSYTLLIDKIANLYNSMYNKLEDKKISTIVLDGERICDNAKQYKIDMIECQKKGFFSLDMEKTQNLINYYCFELVYKYIKIDRLINTM